jgi:hypothetical protein
MLQYWIQPLVWMALAILALIGIYAVIRAGSRAYYKSKAEYESEKNNKEES